jgi:hypothetical protein
VKGKREMSRTCAKISIKLWLITFVTISLLVVGCGGSGKPDDVTDSQVESPITQSPSETSPPTQATDPDEIVSLPARPTESMQVVETIDLVSLDANQANLDDHQVEIRAEFDGENSSGQPVYWTVTSQRSVSRHPAANRLDVTVEGFTGQDDFEEMTIVWIGDESYLVLPSVGCIGRPADGDESVDLLDFVNDFVEGLAGAQLESESLIVNGTPSRYYRFDESARLEWQESGLALDGQLFIAEDGEYVTRLESVASGTLQFHPQRDTETGRFTLKVDVRKLDDSAKIEVPQSCSIPSGYPVVEDAYQITVIDDLVSYRTNLPPPEVLAFYEEEMLNNGWTTTEEAILLEESAFLIYERDGRTLTISLDLDSEEEAITVLITP